MENIFKNYLEDILSFLPVAVLFTDDQGRILKINEKVEKILEYKSHELVDSRLDKIMDVEKMEDVLVKEQRDEKITLKGKNKDILVNFFSEKKIREDKPIILISFFDLSRAQKIEKRMEEKVKELERFNRLATGRELKMVELKREKKKLEKKNEELEKEIKILKKRINRENEQ